MKIFTKSKTLSSDTFTPVGLYMKLRDYHEQPALLEASDYHTKENSLSFIGLDPLLKIVAKEGNRIDFIKKGELFESYDLTKATASQVMRKMFEGIEIISEKTSNFKSHASNAYTGFFGYTSYDAVPLFESIDFKNHQHISTSAHQHIPLIYYLFYKVLIVINHYKDEMQILSFDTDEQACEQRLEKVISMIQNRSSQSFQFEPTSQETSAITDQDFISLVKKGQDHIHKGDVFQIVLSRPFSRKFAGDEFEVYRALRRVNPSPYLFYFDLGDFKLFGSSPEAQLIIKNNKAEIHPIAGTFARSGDDKVDLEKAEELKKDLKETSEHNMLVDLARNDLSRHCNNVGVETLKEIQFYSHVIHLVSKVTGELKKGAFAYDVMMDSFPAGTLSGAPKHRAMQLIDAYETTSRGYYGGAIGYIGLDGSLNHAIMIRTILSKNNELHYRAGAGVVDRSVPEKELNEVNLKIGALRKAIEQASSHAVKTIKQKETVA